MKRFALRIDDELLARLGQQARQNHRSENSEIIMAIEEHLGKEKAMEVIEDREDTKRALVTHEPDGEAYIIEYCSLWQGDKVVGTRIIAAASIERRELDMRTEMLEPSKAAFDRIDSTDWGLTGEDAEWLQAEEDAGHLIYPIGVR